MMKLSSLLLLAAVGAVVGCAAPADEQGDSELPSPVDVDVTAQASATPTAAQSPIIVLPPLCVAPPPDDTKLLSGPSSQRQAVGRANLADACDRFVLQLDDTLGGDITLWGHAESPASQGYAIPDQARCNASRLSATTRGQLPDRFVWQNGHFVLVPGQWQTIESFSEYGVWSGSACTFPTFQQETNLGGPAGKIDSSPYVRIQMSTRAVFKTASGDVSGWMRSRAIRNDS